MATDYDAPRKTDDDLSEDSLEELKSRRNDSSGNVDVDETEQAEGFELPGADLSGEEMSVRVLPRQADQLLGLGGVELLGLGVDLRLTGLQLGAALLQRDLQLLDEKPLAADLGQRAVEDLVAAGGHAQQRDACGRMAGAQQLGHMVGLPECQFALSGSYSNRLHYAFFFLPRLF